MDFSLFCATLFPIFITYEYMHAAAAVLNLLVTHASTLTYKLDLLASRKKTRGSSQDSPRKKVNASTRFYINHEATSSHGKRQNEPNPG